MTQIRRIEFFNNIDDEVYSAINKIKSSLNSFNYYLGFLQEIKELSKSEELLINTKVHEFIKMIEIKSMSKSCKIPVFLAFYNDGKVKMEIDEDDVYPVIGLCDVLKEYIKDKYFIDEFIDSVEYRKLRYYEERNLEIEK